MFPDVHGCVASQKELAPATVQKLLALLENTQHRSSIQIEMAAVVDAGDIFVRSMYNLEGDGPLALVAYQVIKVVQTTIEMAQFSWFSHQVLPVSACSHFSTPSSAADKTAH